MTIRFKPIGIIHTPNTEFNNSPIQSSRSSVPGRAVVNEEYVEGLDGLEGFSHIFLFYIFHRLNSPLILKVTPFLDDKIHGIFATRFPNRPNRIGFSVVRLTKLDRNMLFFTGADMLNNSPLLDIKPYLPEFDHFMPENIGWYQDRKYE